MYLKPIDEQSEAILQYEGVMLNHFEFGPRSILILNISCIVGHSLFENFHIFFLTRNHGHWLPLEAQIWLKFWSRTMFHLSRLTNFWGKILQKPVELLFFLIFIK